MRFSSHASRPALRADRRSRLSSDHESSAEGDEVSTPSTDDDDEGTNTTTTTTSRSGTLPLEGLNRYSIGSQACIRKAVQSALLLVLRSLLRQKRS